MPNWVTNNIIAKTEKDFLKIKEVLLDEKGSVDFNKLIPMPKDLHITAGGYTWETCDRYGFGGERLEKKIEWQNEVFEEYLTQFYANSINQDDFVESVRSDLKTVKTNYLGKLKELYEIENIDEPNRNDGFGLHNSPFEELIRSFYNIKKYGHANWYNWSIDNWGCDNWGTKWNASETYLNESGVITFDTAWACPFEIISELSKHADFKIAYADEDLGSNYGVVEFENGIGTRIEELDELDYDTAKHVATLIKGYDCEEYWFDGFMEDEETNQEVEKENIEQAKEIGKQYFEEII